MKQLYLINEFKKKSIEDCTISAVLMYGSFIKGEGDKFSDIEFYIFLRDDCHIDKYKWISSVNPIALMFVNEFGTDVVIFDNLIYPIKSCCFKRYKIKFISNFSFFRNVS